MLQMFINSGTTIEKVNNTDKFQYLKKCAIALILLLLVMILLSFISYLCLSYSKKTQENLLVNVYQENVYSLFLNTFGPIFNTQELSQKNLIKNYSIKKGINDKQLKFRIIGTVLEVTSGSKVMNVDTGLFINIINNILENDFYYQILINNSILATNAQDMDFNWFRNFSVSDNIDFVIKISAKKESQLFKNLSTHFNNYIKYTELAAIILFIALSFVVIYLVTKQWKKSQLIAKLYRINEVLEANVNYINKCYTEDNSNTFPISLSPTLKTDSFDVKNCIKILKTNALGYTSLYQYKFELIIEATIDSIPLSFSTYIMEQILISLFHNMLYFMRGGSHKKIIKIIFNKDSISFLYDSFSANEDHMDTWSRGIFERTGNLYLLNTKQTFDLIRKCGLNYEVIPKQGENQVIITLIDNSMGNNVVQLNTRTKK